MKYYIEDIGAMKSTDALADLYDAWLSDNFPNKVREGHRLDAFELWHEIAAKHESLLQAKLWLEIFMGQWEEIQANEDFQFACEMRGE
jgi:hypothetical protein